LDSPEVLKGWKSIDSPEESALEFEKIELNIEKILSIV
jgi:hypothetical protein